MEVSMEIISLERLYDGILAGAEKIQTHRQTLNLSNGFPVPDQDTGNNLAHLMAYIARNLKKEATAQDLMEKVSDYALVGARGNSGAIFSQFFNGFKEACPATPDLSLNHFADGFQLGYQKAYQSIHQPIEGTIVTALRSWSKAFQSALSSHHNLKEIYEIAFSNLSETVENTKNTLPQQRAIQSADAGAKAFLYFIEGFMGLLVGTYSLQHSIESADSLEFSEKHFFSEESISYRYCTEVLYQKKSATDLAFLKKEIAGMGDSFIFSENERLARIHIHVNRPAAVFQKIDRFAKIIETKVDDMKAQQELTHSHQTEIALVTDSIADIPVSLLTKDVYQLPISLMVDGVSYPDKIGTFPELLQSGNVSSSQLNHDQVQRFLMPIFKSYQRVIIITVSAKMSGLHQRCQEVIAQFDGTTDVRLIDSRLNSGGQGLIVYKALQLIQQQLPLDQIVSALQQLIRQTRIFVSVPNLKQMIRSGRLNQRIGFLLQKIGFLPLITINAKGEGTIKGIAFSKQSNQRLLYQQILSTSVLEYALVHAGNSTAIEQMAAELTDKIGRPPAFITEISSIVENFSGRGSVAIAYIKAMPSSAEAYPD